jgi:hypothetical protein
MRVRLKLKPGQRGTKRLLKQYGDRLLCVRYRYDEETKKRYTTVELIVEEKQWEPPRFKPDDTVLIKIAFNELELRQNIKNAGGRWSRSAKAWKLPYKTACKLGLKARIVDEQNEKKGTRSI